MKTRWLRMTVVCVAACMAASLVFAKGEEGAEERKVRREGGGKRRKERDPAMVARWATSGVLTAAASLPEGKAAVAMYQAETEQIDQEMWQILRKYHHEVMEAGENADRDAIAARAKEELIPLAKRVAASRIKLAEALAATAKANPDAVAEKIAEQTAERLKKMRVRSKEGRAKAHREKRRKKEGDAGGEVIE